MKRNYFTFIFAFVLSLMAFNVNAQVTVGTGITSDVNAPITSCYGYSYTEQIYLQSEIGASGNITSVSFYVNSLPTSTANSEDWTIYMGHTTQADYASTTSWVGATTMTQVFSGTVTYPTAGNWMTITLATPFAYNNTDNLIIALDENMAGWNCTVQWANTNVGANRTIYYRSDSNNPDPLAPPTASNTQTNRPNVQLGGITQACPAPSALASGNETTTSADLSWTAGGGETMWNIEHGAAGFAQGSGTAVTGVTNPYTLSSLSAGTSYEYYVQADCGGSGVSLWAGPFTFSTLCATFTAPYNENFDGVSLASPYYAEPNCWDPQAGPDYWDVTNDVINTGHSYLPNIGDHTTGSGNYAWIDASSDITANEMVTSDIDMSSLTTPFAGFWFASNNTANATNHTIALDVWDGTAWINMAMQSGNFPGWVEVSGPVPAGIPTTTKFRIYAIADVGTTSSTYFQNDLGVDDFFVIEAPSCFAPTTLTATNVTATTADFGWTATGPETAWDIEYGLAGFTQGAGTMVTATTTNPHAISNLMDASDYSFYVRANCGNATSLWAGPYNFTTLCLPSIAPYNENFDGLALTSPYTALPNCWDAQVGPDYWDVTNDVTNTGHSWLPNIGDHTTGSGNYMWIDASGDITVNEMVTPMIDMSGLNAGYAGFWFASNNITNNINHTINLDVWDGAAWVNMASMSGNFPSWVEVGGIVPAGIPTTTKFRIYATADANGNSSTYYFNDLGIDDFFVREAPVNEVAVTAITVGNCSSTEAITVDITNNGVNAQTSVPVSLSINGAAPVMEMWTGTLASGTTVQHTFVPTFDASVAGSYNINASVGLTGDENTANDMLLSVVSATAVYGSAYGSNFENSLPTDWTTDGSVGTAHNSGSSVVYRNMYSSVPTFTTTTPKIAVAAGDFASFAYRYSDYSAGTVGTTLGAGDTLNVQVSTDCGVTFTTVDQIDSSNHVVSANFATLLYDLTPYAGQTVVFRMAATWGTGDYFLDVDNFFVGVPMTQTATATDALCVGGVNGSGTVTAADGLAPYTYAWSNGATTAMASGLSVGMNYYTVTDAAGSMIMDSVSIGEPAMAMSAMTSVDAMVSCNGAMDAAVSVMGMNGMAPYTYSWTNGMMADSLMSIGAGTYAVLVTDANGCITLETVSVAEPMTISSMTMATDITCNGAADGTVMTTVAGGTGAYTYSWSNAATTDALTGLAAGTYDVTTTDANGCATTGSVMVTEPMAITATVTTDANVDCNSDANGVVSIAAAGGTGMLSYMWSNNTTMASATNLAGGTYDVTVTDANGCTETGSATVTEAAALTLALATTSDSLYALAGSATATVTGGTEPYTYAWDGTTGTATLDGLGEGVYTVIVTDANGCTIEGFVSVADVVSTASIDYVTNLSIAPNPARDYATIELELSQNADVAISIYTITGVLVQDFAKENTSRQTHQVDLSNYADGMYFVRILVDNQIVTKKLVVTK
jgi:hypothetical protein